MEGAALEILRNDSEGGTARSRLPPSPKRPKRVSVSRKIPQRARTRVCFKQWILLLLLFRKKTLDAVLFSIRDFFLPGEMCGFNCVSISGAMAELKTRSNSDSNKTK